MTPRHWTTWTTLGVVGALSLVLGYRSFGVGREDGAGARVETDGVDEVHVSSGNPATSRESGPSTPAEPEVAVVPHLDRANPNAHLLGYAFTENGYDYVAYLRWLWVRFPEAGQRRIGECRLRFSLDERGPDRLRIRGHVNVGGSVTNARSIPALSETESSPDRSIVGIGDFDGSTPAYYDEGAFYTGLVRVHGNHESGMTGRISLECRYVEDATIATDTVHVAVALDDPGDDVLDLRATGAHPDYGDAWTDYVALLEELAKPRYRVHPLRDVPAAEVDPEHVTVFVRHDTDLTMYGALQMARAEADRGLRTTYFVNMMSSIYGLVTERGDYTRNPAALENLLEFQRMGHEVGLHTDSVIARTHYAVPVRGWLRHELARLRAHGIEIVSESENGSPHAESLSTENRYTFTDYREGGRLRDHIDWCDRPNGFHGRIVIEGVGEHNTVRLPDVSLEELGLHVSTTFLQRFIPHAPDDEQYDYQSDVAGGAEYLIEQLRAAKPGMTIQLMTHCNRWTTHCEELELAVDDPGRYGTIAVERGTTTWAGSPRSAAIEGETEPR